MIHAGTVEKEYDIDLGVRSDKVDIADATEPLAHYAQTLETGLWG